MSLGADVIGGGAHRVARAVGLLLDRHLDAVGQRLRERALRAVDDDDPAGAGLAGRGDRPLDDRPPAERMQHLREVRPHPGPLAGGEDQHGGSGHRGIVVSAPPSTCPGGSSNGKTPVFGAGYRGSSPCPPTRSSIRAGPPARNEGMDARGGVSLNRHNFRLEGLWQRLTGRNAPLGGTTSVTRLDRRQAGRNAVSIQTIRPARPASRHPAPDTFPMSS